MTFRDCPVSRMFFAAAAIKGSNTAGSSWTCAGIVRAKLCMPLYAISCPFPSHSEHAQKSLGDQGPCMLPPQTEDGHPVHVRSGKSKSIEPWRDHRSPKAQQQTIDDATPRSCELRTQQSSGANAVHVPIWMLDIAGQAALKGATFEIPKQGYPTSNRSTNSQDLPERRRRISALRAAVSACSNYLRRAAQAVSNVAAEDCSTFTACTFSVLLKKRDQSVAQSCSG